MTDINSGDTSAGPTSFSDPSLKWDASPEPAATPPVASETTEPSATTAPSPADATTPPVEVATSPDDAVAPPSAEPIPFERHKAILESERQKLTDLESRMSSVEWAKALVDAGKTPEQVRDAVGILDGLNSDYVGTLDRLFRYADSNPELQAHVRSLAGRWLGQSATAQPEVDPEPQPDFVEPNSGKPVFSAERLREWNDWHARQLEGRISQRFDPLVKAHEAAQNRERMQADANRQYATLKAEFDRYAVKPHFQEHKAAIQELIKASGWTMSIADAYNEILVTKVLPNATQAGAAQKLAELKTRAAASSPTASASASGTPADVKSFADKRLKW